MSYEGEWTIEGHAAEWAERQRVPQEVAELYAAEYGVMAAAGDFGPGNANANHVVDWPAWVARRFASCIVCGSPWAVQCLSCEPARLECAECGAFTSAEVS